MIDKLLTLIWFSKRPSHWRHAAALVHRQFQVDHGSQDQRSKARDWAAARAVSVADALSSLEISGEILSLPAELITDGQDRALKSSVKMGGPGDIDLLFNAVRLIGATRVVETGVAYGWSSLAMLAAMDDIGTGQLVSVDMPYPKMGNEEFVGLVVPERLRSRWAIIRQPDRGGLEKAITAFGGQIDLCHYDSDKSWQGRDYAFPKLWSALRPDGLFICDDIQDNMYFAEFAAEKGVPFAVTEFKGKFVGLIRKLS